MAIGATVDHKSLVCQYGPHSLAKGRAKGDYLQIVYNTDAFQEVVGIDEEGFWIANGDISARITMTFLQSADVNTLLSGLHIIDRRTPGGLLLPMIIREKNGATAYAAARARIVKMADGIWSDGGAVRQWTFSTIALRGTLGGVSSTPINPNP